MNYPDDSEYKLTVGNAIMDVLAGMIRQTGIVSDEAKLREHLRYEHSRGLLPVHANGQRLRTPEEEERVKRRQPISDRVDHERDLLRQSTCDEHTRLPTKPSYAPSRCRPGCR